MRAWRLSLVLAAALLAMAAAPGLAQAHGIPDGAIAYYKLLRPLRRGLPFSVEEEIVQGIVKERWALQRVRREVEKRSSRELGAEAGKAAMAAHCAR